MLSMVASKVSATSNVKMDRLVPLAIDRTAKTDPPKGVLGAVSDIVQLV